MRVIGILLAATLALAGCTGQSGAIAAGAAATVGNQRISQDELTTKVQEVLTAQQRPLDSQDGALTSTMLTRMIRKSLLVQFATANGLTRPSAETIDDYARNKADYPETDAELYRLWFQALGIPPNQIADAAETDLLVLGLGEFLAPGADLQVQLQAVNQQIAAYSVQVGVQVSPRYGTWDARQLGVGPLPDDLSVPAA